MDISLNATIERLYVNAVKSQAREPSIELFYFALFRHYQWLRSLKARAAYKLNRL